jgi:hypothetical protein
VFTLYIEKQAIPIKWDQGRHFAIYKDGTGHWSKSYAGNLLANTNRQVGPKSHRIQGPIDDAFMNSFLFVPPLTNSQDPWVKSEYEYAITHWRQQFRGDVRTVQHDAVDDQEAIGNNLILWGTPWTNAYIAKIMPKLPIQWDKKHITVGDKKYDAEHHRLIMIYPNPLNPGRYIVLNSGFTYREYDYLNNARQVSKLPDWAVVDIRQPADSRGPGKIVNAGFFDEEWKLKTDEP